MLNWNYLNLYRKKEQGDNIVFGWQIYCDDGMCIHYNFTFEILWLTRHLRNTRSPGANTTEQIKLNTTRIIQKGIL